MSQVPSVGRIVHYHSYGTPGGEYKSEPRAAVVTKTYAPLPPPESSAAHHPYGPDYVDLCVLNPEGMFFNRAVPFSAEPKPGHWSWPPLVPPAK